MFPPYEMVLGSDGLPAWEEIQWPTTDDLKAHLLQCAQTSSDDDAIAEIPFWAAVDQFVRPYAWVDETGKIGEYCIFRGRTRDILKDPPDWKSLMLREVYARAFDYHSAADKFSHVTPREGSAGSAIPQGIAVSRRYCK